MAYNKPINTASKKRRSFVAMVFAAGYRGGCRFKSNLRPGRPQESGTLPIWSTFRSPVDAL